MRITASEAVEKFRTQPEKCVLLDVRTAAEYRQVRIKGSLNADFYSGFDRQVEKLDKGKTYLVFCASGGRSQAAVAFMRQKGFEAYNAGAVGDLIQADLEYERD